MGATLSYSRIPVGKCRRNNGNREYLLTNALVIVSGSPQWILNLVGRSMVRNMIFI